MKFLKLFLNMRLAMILVLPVFLLSITGCDDDETIIVIPVEDGTYLAGSSTGSGDLSTDFAMQDGRVEGDGFSTNLRTGMYEGFGYLVAGDLVFVIKAGASEVSYGAAAGTQTTNNPGGADSQIDADVETGTLMEGGGAINVASAGFYHAVMDMETMTFHLYKIRDLEVSATGTQVAKVSASAAGAQWQATGVLVTGNIKFRWNDGWKYIEEDGPTFADDYIIFCNFGKGTSASEIIAGGGEWAPADLPDGAAIYTITVDWTPGDGWSLTFLKTGDAPSTDLSVERVELVGAGVYKDGVLIGWPDGQLATASTPTNVGGTLYRWTYTGISFDITMGFKFRTENNWSGLFNIGWNELTTIDGPDASVVQATGGDLQGNVAGTDYTLDLTIDANDISNIVLTVTAE